MYRGYIVRKKLAKLRVDQREDDQTEESGVNETERVTPPLISESVETSSSQDDDGVGSRERRRLVTNIIIY